MTGASMTVRVNDADVAMALSRLAGHLGDTTPLMASIGQSLVASTLHRFETGRGPGGISWVPLAPSTKRRKAKAGRTKLLIWSARLRGSINARPSASEVVVGTNVEYAGIHQFGAEIETGARSQLYSRGAKGRFAKLRRTKAGALRDRASLQAMTIGAGRRIIPARPYLGLDDQDIEVITELTADFVEGGAP